MELGAVILLAIGLSMDSLVVSAACGIILRKFYLHEILLISLFLGFFQGLMPFIGWLLGTAFHKYIQTYDHWIALILLSAIGIKMIWEGIFSKAEERCFDPMDLKVLFGLSIATSIDALAVGITLGVLSTPILRPSILIGIVTFLVAFTGTTLGIKMGRRFNFRLEIIGGIVLMGIGIKIFAEHLIQNI